MSRKREIKRQHRINNQNALKVEEPYRIEVKNISINLLCSPDFQRTVNMQRVRKIARDFDWNKMNIIKASFRDGQYHVFDGAHTLMAMKLLHGDEDFEVPCRVYHGLSYQ